MHIWSVLVGLLFSIWKFPLIFVVDKIDICIHLTQYCINWRWHFYWLLYDAGAILHGLQRCFKSLRSVELVLEGGGWYQGSHKIQTVRDQRSGSRGFGEGRVDFRIHCNITQSAEVLQTWGCSQYCIIHV